MAKYPKGQGAVMRRRTKRVRSKQARPEIIETAYQRALKENPEIQLVLEIAQRARDVSALQIPLDFDLGPTTTTATAATGQNLLVVA